MTYCPDGQLIPRENPTSAQSNRLSVLEVEVSELEKELRIISDVFDNQISKLPFEYRTAIIGFYANRIESHERYINSILEGLGE